MKKSFFLFISLLTNSFFHIAQSHEKLDDRNLPSIDDLISTATTEDTNHWRLMGQKIKLKNNTLRNNSMAHALSLKSPSKSTKIKWFFLH